VKHWLIWININRFLAVVKDDNWYAYDLRPLKQAISKQKLKVEDLELERVIKGYDYLIFIPNITRTPKRGNKTIKSFATAVCVIKIAALVIYTDSI
jgi:hypothetical protein